MIHVALETSSRPPSLAVQVGEQVRTAALGEGLRTALMQDLHAARHCRARLPVLALLGRCLC